VGHLAGQIAAARGAYVFATARADKHGFLADLGVDEAIDYTQQPFEEGLRDVDAVVDLVGGETGRRSLAVLHDGALGAVGSTRIPVTRTRSPAACRSPRLPPGWRGSEVLDRLSLEILVDATNDSERHPP
jgi:D-arabinose 1-dehydrogenase-like Zn-dependent alcohol dehydrogenase